MRVQLGFAIALTALFVVLVIVMIVSANAPTAEWQNLVYIFGSVEALVFTAIGWVFGREVQRSAVSAARSNEQDAKAEARANADKSQQASDEAANERSKLAQLAAGVEIATAAQLSQAARVAGAARDVGLDDDSTVSAAGELAGPLAELRALANRLHPPTVP